MKEFTAFLRIEEETAMVDAINVAFTPEYDPLIVEIDKACDACGISRSGLIRSLLCDVFEFTPESPGNVTIHTRKE